MKIERYEHSGKVAITGRVNYIDCIPFLPDEVLIEKVAIIGRRPGYPNVVLGISSLSPHRGIIHFEANELQILSDINQEI
jgi:hypothetical protein